jgi:hypothetical protein
VAKKDGKALELLVRAIESAIAAGNSNIKIETSKHFPDKVTGQPREHDVVLTITNAHHQTVVALECRDLSRPIGVGAVEQFHTKCQDTGIHSGIIVSPKGFAATALEKASHYNIRCLSLEEAKSFDSCLATGVESCLRKIHGVHFELKFAPPKLPNLETIQTEDGTPVNSEMVGQWAHQASRQHNPIPSEEPGEHRVNLLYQNPGVYGVIDGERVRAIEAIFTLDYVTTIEFAPFIFRTYRDVGKSEQLKQVAVCQVPLDDGKRGELVLSPDEEGLITISLVLPPADK